MPKVLIEARLKQAEELEMAKKSTNLRYPRFEDANSNFSLMTELEMAKKSTNLRNPRFQDAIYNSSSKSRRTFGFL